MFKMIAEAGSAASRLEGAEALGRPGVRGCRAVRVSENGLVEGRGSQGEGSGSAAPGQQRTCSALSQTCCSSDCGAGVSPPTT